MTLEWKFSKFSLMKCNNWKSRFTIERKIKKEKKYERMNRKLNWTHQMYLIDFILSAVEFSLHL